MRSRFDLDGRTKDFKQHAPPQAQGLMGALGKMQSLFPGGMPGFTMMGLGGMMSFGGKPGGPQPLRLPPNEQQLDAAAKAIGRPLPAEVRQLIRDRGWRIRVLAKGCCRLRNWSTAMSR